MKKACVISSYAYIDENINYGALLQYYALENALNQIGLQSYWLRFCLPDSNKLVHRVKRLIKNIIYMPNSILYNKCLCSFKDFISKYCHESNCVYYSEQELKINIPPADVYITGSDQVWGGMLAPNYLTFVPDSIPKISYAASFGKNQISKEHKKIITPWLKRFDAISVREECGVKICQEMGLNAQWVVDPTLLLEADEYPVVETDNSPDVYCYFLNFTDKEHDLHWNKILSFSEENNYTLKVACTNQTYKKFGKAYRDLPTPVEWLSRYKNAKYIITNTFHGTVFAIIFKKNFLVVKQKGEGAKQNGRVESLLKLLNLETRCYDDSKEINAQIDSPIDWENVNAVLEKERESSFNYIREAIKKTLVTYE